jgi:hypothetical protein
MLAMVRHPTASRFRVAWLVACVLLVGSLAFAGKEKPLALSGRVVDLDIYRDSTVVTVMRGSDNGLAKGWKAAFREGTTTKLLPGGDATVIRVDRRSTVLKTTLTPEQVRANRVVQFDPP